MDRPGRRRWGLALCALALAGCGGGGETAAAPEPSPPGGADATAAATATPTPTPTPEPTPEPVRLADDELFGPDCKELLPSTAYKLLARGPAGSAALIATTAPKLKAMGSVWFRAGMLRRRDQTVFIPTERAYQRLSLDAQFAVLHELRKPIAGHHVVKGRRTPRQLIGENETRVGDVLAVDATGPRELLVGGRARVLCGNIRTRDSTVYVIDTILSPRGLPPLEMKD